MNWPFCRSAISPPREATATREPSADNETFVGDGNGNSCSLFDEADLASDQIDKTGVELVPQVTTPTREPSDDTPAAQYGS